MAHEIPYVATATVADLHDLEAKVERAMEIRGARYLHVFVPCPLGWGSASRGHDPDRAAGQGERRSSRSSRRSDGEVVGVSKIRRQVPVEDYLRPQRRYAHLFGDPTAHRGDRAAAGDRRPQHPPLRAARRRTSDATDRGRRRRAGLLPMLADSEHGPQ